MFNESFTVLPVNVLPYKIHTVHGTNRTRSVELWVLHAGAKRNISIRVEQQASMQHALPVSSAVLHLFNSSHAEEYILIVKLFTSAAQNSNSDGQLLSL
jgi:hypothetical protein